MTAITDLDEDAIFACADLVERTGATEFQIGYLNDDPPHEWYAHAQYRGARISVEKQAGPVEAADALCRRLLAGAQCTRCKRNIALASGGRSRCRWRRMGPKWVRGCEDAS